MLDIDTFVKGLDSKLHTPQSRRNWIELFYRDMQREANIEAASRAITKTPDGLTEWVERYFERLDLIRATNDPEEQGFIGAGVMEAEREIRTRLRKEEHGG